MTGQDQMMDRSTDQDGSSSSLVQKGGGPAQHIRLPPLLGACSPWHDPGFRTG